MLTDELRAAGWIEHDGGPCPVPLDSWPEVMFASDGDIYFEEARLWTRRPSLSRCPHSIVAAALNVYASTRSSRSKATNSRCSNTARACARRPLCQSAKCNF